MSRDIWLSLGSGLVGAVVASLLTVLGMVWLQARQQGSERRAAEASGRLIYLEILLNLALLDAGQQVRPASLYLTHETWDRLSSSLVSLLDEQEAATVAAPYLQFPVTERLLSRRGIEMIRIRLAGVDRNTIANLSSQLRAAETVLRPKLWSGRRQRELETVMSNRPEVTFPGGPVGGARDVLASTPMKVALLALVLDAVWLFRDPLRKGVRSIRQWLNDT